MPKAKRNVGQEILEGIRQLKRGEHGRVVKVPSVSHIREKTGLSRQELLTRLSKTLPDAVDQYTPDGRLPSNV